MEVVLQILPIIVYSLLIAVLIISIILGIKAIKTLSKVDKVIDNLNEKFEMLSPVFSIIDYTADRITNVTDRVIEMGTFLISKLFRRKDEKK